MSNVDSCPLVVLVPNDENQPIIGPFMLACGDSQLMHIEFARSLGFKDDEYIFRAYQSLNQAMDDHGISYE